MPVDRKQLALVLKPKRARAAQLKRMAERKTSDKNDGTLLEVLAVADAHIDVHIYDDVIRLYDMGVPLAAPSAPRMRRRVEEAMRQRDGAVASIESIKRDGKMNPRQYVRALSELRLKLMMAEDLLRLYTWHFKLSPLDFEE